jgi:hypothetical protein
MARAFLPLTAQSVGTSGKSISIAFWSPLTARDGLVDRKHDWLQISFGQSHDPVSLDVPLFFMHSEILQR